jgi:hypothetical protein
MGRAAPGRRLCDGWVWTDKRSRGCTVTW